MQFGLTIPLQRYLKRAPPPTGAAAERLYCWDLHRIPLYGRGSLLAVHCASRYAVVAFDLSAADWAALEQTALIQIQRGLREAGLRETAARAYLEKAGAPCFTRTHGRREVAFLNRAWEDVAAHDFALDPSMQPQPLLEEAANGLPCRCAGKAGLDTARGHLLRLLGR